MPLQATSGAASYDAFGGGAAAVPTYIEDVFSCFLYDGNSSTQTITNNIDLSTKGGLVWIKVRTHTWDHILTDTVRGATTEVFSDLTAGNITNTDDLTAFTSSGFSVGNGNAVNQGSPVRNYVSWTFREQPKFFDIVTYTGTGSNTTVAHSLGSVPGCIMVKRTDTSSAWAVYHRSLANTQYLVLNTTAAAATGATWWNSTTPTSSVFSVGTDASVNASGGTYVAYIFAHDAGGFGLTGTDNVISCGSYATDGSFVGPNVNLGYEPQWILVKNSTANGAWNIIDNMRGWESGGNVTLLNPNTSSAESTTTQFKLNATGFQDNGAFAGSATMIYIAIRRGPMKVPTVGTSVFAPILATASTGTSRTVGFPADMTISRIPSLVNGNQIVDRLRGYANTSAASPSTLATNSSAAESAVQNFVYNVWNTTALDGPYADTYSNLWLHFRRAPSFMDVVCYTGTGVNGRSVSHNLAFVPELIISKRRNSSGGFFVYVSSIGTGQYLTINSISGPTTDVNMWGNTNPTSSNFYVGSSTNFSGFDYVSYLFATCAGVSKVGSYTGTGSTLQVDCGFTSGARFVLIKRGDGSGDWYVWDSARGIVAGNDPYLLLNDTAAEVTNTDYIDTYSAGFEVTTGAAVNSVGDLFIFLAIA